MPEDLSTPAFQRGRNLPTTGNLNALGPVSAKSDKGLVEKLTDVLSDIESMLEAQSGKIGCIEGKVKSRPEGSEGRGKDLKPTPQYTIERCLNKAGRIATHLDLNNCRLGDINERL